jgi:glycosyltransferase involved in cell wall biosynthesis
MCRVLLFDLHSDGHHLEYASRVQSLVAELLPESTVDMLVPSTDPNHDQHFHNTNITYLRGEGFDVSKELSDRPVAVRNELVSEAVEFATNQGYNVLHFLQIDDIVREVHNHTIAGDFEPAVVGSIIGSFFNESSLLNRIVSKILRSPVGKTVEPVIPEQVNDVRRHRNDVYMYRAMRQRSLDHVFVPTEQGRSYLAELAPEFVDNAVSIVPDPTELYFESGLNQCRAREQLGLSAEETILLFFGGMREEKGIQTLLEALRRYDGPRFTMLLVGSPVDVSEAYLEATAAASVADVRPVLEYVPEEQVVSYFRAADGVVTPYQRSFGRRRPSNVFQKATGAGRPVIAPNFGVFADCIEKWNLGLTFEPESPTSLAEAMSIFAQSDEIGDPEGIERYARSQTYQKLAQTVADSYRGLLDVEES